MAEGIQSSGKPQKIKKKEKCNKGIAKQNFNKEELLKPLLKGNLFNLSSKSRINFNYKQY